MASKGVCLSYFYLTQKGVQEMEKDYIKHGDCLELMAELPDKSIDMILCDLPYGTTDCGWDCIIPFDPL